MPVPIRSAALIAAAVFTATSLHAAPAGSPLGVWLDHTGRGAVEIKPCGDKLCGHVVWVKSTDDAKGCGRQIIGDAVAGGKVAHSGWIYSPEKRKRYNVELSPMADGRLKVLGYAGTKLFSKTMYWTPAAAGLERCGGTTTAAAPTAPVAPAPGTVTNPAPKAPAVQVPQQVQAKPAAAAPAKTQQAAAPAAPSATPSVAAQLRSPATEQAQTTTAAPEAAEPEEQDVAAGDSETTEDGPPRRLAEILDQVLTKSGDGNCKLDLPWVKVKFRCED
jgi:uncharacterized protein (DUF2147 family)